ncbi:MAG: thermonuclease family protein [Bryobacteraceae bacterium]|nr:thermonuclease family protein [Bryobacteraceae bacterium]
MRWVLLAAACLPLLAESFAARVVAVADGDTVTVLRGREQVRVRLYGIDCPELGQPFGRRARQRTGELAFGQTVTVRGESRDRYGRLVAWIELPDGRSLNEVLVAEGLAWHYRRYAPRALRLAQLEQEARAARRGLWQDPDPVPPWQWRRPARSRR